VAGLTLVIAALVLARVLLIVALWLGLMWLTFLGYITLPAIVLAAFLLAYGPLNAWRGRRRQTVVVPLSSPGAAGGADQAAVPGGLNASDRGRCSTTIRQQGRSRGSLRLGDSSALDAADARGAEARAA
jgi:hypothetical protein